MEKYTTIFVCTACLCITYILYNIILNHRLYDEKIKQINRHTYYLNFQDGRCIIQGKDEKEF